MSTPVALLAQVLLEEGAEDGLGVHPGLHLLSRHRLEEGLHLRLPLLGVQLGFLGLLPLLLDLPELGVAPAFNLFLHIRDVFLGLSAFLVFQAKGLVLHHLVLLLVLLLLEGGIFGWHLGVSPSGLALAPRVKLCI